jgi:hypothetical protein
MKLFFALAAAKGFVIFIADTTNAYQQSPPPMTKCFLCIDDAYRSWHRKRFGTDIDPDTYVIPLECALQGHPEAGALWEKMIVSILEGDELKFKSTTHELNLYRGTSMVNLSSFAAKLTTSLLPRVVHLLPTKSLPLSINMPPLVRKALVISLLMAYISVTMALISIRLATM